MSKTTKPTTIIRAPRDKDNPYFAFRRKTAQDRRLSFEARGVLAYLLSKPGDWEISVPDLMHEGDCGRDRVLRILKELEKFGYMEKEKQTKNQEGKFETVPLIVREAPSTENPDTVEGEPSTEKPSTDKPSTENPQEQKKDSTESTESQKKTSDPDGSGEAQNGGLTVPKSKSWSEMKTQEQSRAMFQAICDVFRYDSKTLTKSKRGQINAAEKELREANATPADVPGVYAYCVRNLEHFGPNALATKLDDWRAERRPVGLSAAPNPLKDAHRRADPHCPHCGGTGQIVSAEGKTLLCVCVKEADHAAA